MAGMKGFTHKCESQKIEWQSYKRSLRDSSFSHAQVSMIWDFYVTHSFAGGSGQGYSLEDYGWDLKKGKEKTLTTLEEELMQMAEIDKLCCVRSTTIKDTLIACNLSGKHICIEHPRAVLMQNYSMTIDENETMKFAGGGGAENRITCLFRHIRNSVAHGNTYFFDNSAILLEDKDGSKKITARILLKQKTLLDWISIIDKDKKHYELIDVCKSCSQEAQNCT